MTDQENFNKSDEEKECVLPLKHERLKNSKVCSPASKMDYNKMDTTDQLYDCVEKVVNRLFVKVS